MFRSPKENEENPKGGAQQMNNNFMNSLPEANQIFDMGQHLKRNIYPFDMKSKCHIQEWERMKYSKGRPEQFQFRPLCSTVMQYFESASLVYDKFNSNSDEQLFNLNLYPLEKLRNLKNTDYITNVEPTRPLHNLIPPYLSFDSRFQSGNLSMAAYSDELYSLLLHNDVNTFGYTNWFYFQVRNRHAGRYKFAIMNYGKAGWMYNQGVRICVYSKKSGWTRSGQNIHCQSNRTLFAKGNFLNFNTLYFEYEFPDDNSDVYFSYNVPYTYNDLCCFLDGIQSPYFHRKLAGLSLAGNRLEMLTVTNFDMQRQGTELPVIILMARAHSGETVSSWLMHELLKFLLSDTPEARLIRDNFVFKLFPMLNPDGVIHGNYRCSLSGRDLNRRWQDPNKDLFPEVYFIKNQIYELSRKKQIKMILDLHGHSQRKKVFAYGCHDKNEPHRSRLFPYVVSKMTECFDFRSCNFCIDKSKYGTARVTLFHLLKIPYVFTIESSQFGVADEHLSLSVFTKIAESLIKGILTIFKIKLKRQTSCLKDDKFQESSKKSALEVADFDIDDFQKELQSDAMLMRVGLEKDDGSDSEPSVDNITIDRLAELNQRKCLRINTNIAKPNRARKLSTNSGNLHKIEVEQKKARPMTGYYRNNNKISPHEEGKKVTQRSGSIARRMGARNETEKVRKVDCSMDERRRERGDGERRNISYINYSLSISEEGKGPYMAVPLNLRFQNRELYNKLRTISRNYTHFRKLK